MSRRKSACRRSHGVSVLCLCFFFQAEDGIRDLTVTGVQTCALPISYRDLLTSPRWMRAYNAGARPQRLLWASTGTKDPKASDVLYIKSLAAPFTVNKIGRASCRERV